MKLARESLIEILAAAAEDVVRELSHVPIAHWNEDVFRFFIVRRFIAEMPKVDCRTEWNRIDLVFPSLEGALLLELKFFDSRPHSDHTGALLRIKGGPSGKNAAEFHEAIQKLRGIRRKPWIAECGGVASAHLLLAYFDPIRPKPGSSTYGSYYSDIGIGDGISWVHVIQENTRIGEELQFNCKLITVDLGDPEV